MNQNSEENEFKRIFEVASLNAAIRIQELNDAVVFSGTTALAAIVQGTQEFEKRKPVDSLGPQLDRSSLD